MTKIARYLQLTILLLVIMPNISLAWGIIGHRVITQLAEENISKKTKKEIDRLLEGYPMAYWSNWADFIKSDTTGKWEHTYIWHYINIPGNLSFQPFLDEIKKVEQENVYSQIPVLQETLKNKSTSDDDKRIALYFLIHLVADMHQPMHIGRADDLGGNLITVYWFNNPTNIHSIWDSALLNYENYSYTEYTTILNKLNKTEKNKLKSGTLEDWLFETYQITNEIYASINQEDKLRYEYQYKYKFTVESLLKRAGLRLAQILDESFN